MNTEIDRKIAVIFVADVVGYSKHMERDENATIKSYSACEKILNELLNKYKGSVFNTGGDSVLVEFPSAVNAVECGVAFQKEIKKRNASDKTEIKLEYRIGINMGDVVNKDGNLIGDGVNIAARLEALAQTNGITISKSVYDFVVPKTKMTFNDLGVQKVKQNEFHAFDILLDPSQKRTLKTKSSSITPIIGTVAAAVIIVVGIFYFTGQHTGSQKANMAQEQSREKVLGKTILISPFQNKSGLKEFDAIADGISDHLISSLSPTTLLKVLPRKQSQFAKEQNFTLDEIQSNLGASFVLDGGITTSNEKFRVTIEMIDIKEDEVIWSSTQEFNVSNLFEAQDQLEFIVRRAIQANLTMGENLSKYIASSFSNSADYKKVLSLRVDNVKNSLKITNDYVEAYKKVYENNPNNSLALTLYAQAMYHQLFSIGLPFKDYAVAEEAISKAIKIDSKNSLAYPLMAQIKRNMMGNTSLDFEEITRKGLELDPENYETIIQVAHNLVFISKFSEAITLYKKALKIAPYGPLPVRLFLLKTYSESGVYSVSEELAKELILQEETHKKFWGTAFYASILYEKNKIKVGKEILNDYLTQNDISFKEFVDEIWLSPFTGTITGDFDPVIDDVVYNLKMTYDPSLIDKSEEEGKDWTGSSQKD